MTIYQVLQDVVMTLITQGDTGTPSVVEVSLRQNRRNLARKFAIQANICDEDGFTDAANATIAPTTGYAKTLATIQATKRLVLGCPLPVSATGTLTLTGVAIDGQKIVINGRTYELDDDGNYTGVQVDISEYSVKAQGTLTIAEPVTLGDVIQIGTKTYVFVTGSASDEGEIGLGADEAATKVNIVAAINGTDGANTANSLVSAAAFDGDACVLTALVGGTAGNSIVSAEIGQGLTHASNIFDATTLGTTTAGVDCTAANAVTAIVAAITGDSSAIVSAADGAGDTVVVTALTSGADGNAITTTETMTNGGWGAGVLSGGVSENDGKIRISVTNAQAETVVLRLGAAPIASPAVDLTEAYLEITHAAA